MQYAILNNIRSLAVKGTNGICELCKEPVIAKCGDVKLHHWAHQNIKNCDHWWEPETIWHRNWKNQYLESFREKPFVDEIKSELHRADIHTDKGITIEFQYSAIKPEEQLAREQFYSNLIWVVNGARLKRDLPRFQRSGHRFTLIKGGIFKLDYSEACFPVNWASRTVPVIFDFFGSTSEDNQHANTLYCLLPNRLGRYAIVAILSRQEFVKATSEGYWMTWLNNLSADINQVSSEIEENRRLQDNQRVDILSRRIPARRTRRF